MKRLLPIVVAIFVVLLITSCSGAKTDPSVKAVENYINALVNNDSARLSSLSCADWETKALLELDSLQAVDTRLEGLTCSVVGNDGIYTQVNCKGKIIATYNNEDQEIDLSVRNYQVEQQGSDYLVCGYQ